MVLFLCQKEVTILLNNKLTVNMMQHRIIFRLQDKIAWRNLIANQN